MLVKLLYPMVNIGYPICKKFIPHQVYLYLVTGAINTLLNMGLFALGVLVLSDNMFAIEIATIISFIVTVCTGFWFSKNFAFKQINLKKNETKKQFNKYIVVALQGQINGYLLTKALIIFFMIKPIVAYVFTAIFMLTLNYFLQKYFSFNKSI